MISIQITGIYLRIYGRCCRMMTAGRLIQPPTQSQTYLFFFSRRMKLSADIVLPTSWVWWRYRKIDRCKWHGSTTAVVRTDEPSLVHFFLTVVPRKRFVSYQVLYVVLGKYVSFTQRLLFFLARFKFGYLVACR